MSLPVVHCAAGSVPVTTGLYGSGVWTTQHFTSLSSARSSTAVICALLPCLTAAASCLSICAVASRVIIPEWFRQCNVHFSACTNLTSLWESLFIRCNKLQAVQAVPGQPLPSQDSQAGQSWCWSRLPATTGSGLLIALHFTLHCTTQCHSLFSSVRPATSQPKQEFIAPDYSALYFALHRTILHCSVPDNAALVRTSLHFSSVFTVQITWAAPNMDRQERTGVFVLRDLPLLLTFISTPVRGG